MIQGKHAFYTIQFMQTHETKWLDPKGEFYPVDGKEWDFAGSISFFQSINPWKKSKDNGWGEPVDKEADKEWHNCYKNFGLYGWYNIKFAKKAIKRLESEDVFYSRDGYNHISQALKFEFRIVKIEQEYSRIVSPIDVEAATEDQKIREIVLAEVDKEKSYDIDSLIKKVCSKHKKMDKKLVGYAILNLLDRCHLRLTKDMKVELNLQS